MYQRHARPSRGFIGRPLSQDISSIANASRRAFSSSSSMSEEKDPSSPTTPQPPQGDTRAARSSKAFQQLNNLSASKGLTIGGLRAGLFRSGQKPATPPSATILRRTPPARLPDGTLAQRTTPRDAQLGASEASAPPKMLIRRVSDPNQTYSDGLSSGGRFTPRTGGPRAPREGGFAGGPGGRGRGGGGKREGGGKGRDDQKGGRGRPPREIENAADHLSDADVLHLLRLQRAAWDPKPYEPIYAENAAINDLVENGRKYVCGEEVEEKPWVRLNRPEKKALLQEKMRVEGGRYEISALGLADGSKAEERWAGIAVRGVQTNGSFTTKDREMFLGKIRTVLGVKTPLQATTV